MFRTRIVARVSQSTHHCRLAAGVLALLAMIVLVGCSNAPAPAASALPTETPQPSAPLPERQNSAIVRPAEGGQVGLRDGAEVTLPRDSVTDSTLVTLAVDDNPPPAPVPRSIIGKAYEFTLDGSNLAGVAMLTLPLPAGVNGEQFDMAPYRWNGRTWERLAGRMIGQTLRTSSDKPAVFALLGQWRMADASLTLSTQGVGPGQLKIPLQVTGQYRYSAPPTQQHDYTQATVVLKRDSSGGAGRIGGDDSVDQTVSQTVLWFKADPGRADGRIDFSYVFEISPEMLDVPLGSLLRFYAVLTVADSAAPTRRFSSGAEYTQMVPIELNGTEVVRPAVAKGQEGQLQWRVRLNDKTLFVRPATEPRLSLAEALAQGGLGEYKVSLETLADGKYMTVSNEVTVQLALPTTPTVVVPTAAPSPGAGQPGTTPAPGSTPTVPITGTVSPFGTMPPTPTRRSHGLQPTTTPTATITVTPTVAAETSTPEPTRPGWANEFWAESYNIVKNDCTTLHWQTENVQAVYLDGTSVNGVDTKQVCPTETTSYTLHVKDESGADSDRTLTIVVETDTSVPAVDFWADKYWLKVGDCTSLHWNTTGVQAVYLDDVGVPGDSSKDGICPQETEAHSLKVVSTSGTQTYPIRILVVPADTIPIQFWADQYTMDTDICTSIHWRVTNVDSVHLIINGDDNGVEGTSSRDNICPSSSSYYELKVTKDDIDKSRKIHLMTRDGSLTQPQVIAQGLVNDVRFLSDMDSTTAGDQPGWQVTVDGVNVLYNSSPSCCQANVKLLISQSLSEVEDPYSTVLDWPLDPGQQIEFRASCTNNVCRLTPAGTFYVKLVAP